MIQLLIYAGIAIAILGAVYGVDRSRQAIGERRALAEWAPAIEECKALGNEKPADCAVAIRAAVKGRDDAVAANKSLGLQIDTMIATRNAEVDAANAEYTRMQAAKKASAVALAPRLDQLAMDKFNMIVALGKGAGLTCDELDARLLEEGKRRMRDYGVATPPTIAPTAGPRIVEPAPKGAAPVNPLKPKP